MAGRRTKQDKVNALVEDALLRKATGYLYTQQDSYKLKAIVYGDDGKKESETESVQVVDVQKYVPSEYSAIALWLKSRMPQKWGEAANSVPQAVVQIIDNIPDTLPEKVSDTKPHDTDDG
ncbi:MAG: hypothetical protein RSD23_05735 [Ruthenibacterium sp.]